MLRSRVLLFVVLVLFSRGLQTNEVVFVLPSHTVWFVKLTQLPAGGCLFCQESAIDADEPMHLLPTDFQVQGYGAQTTLDLGTSQREKRQHLRKAVHLRCVCVCLFAGESVLEGECNGNWPSWAIVLVGQFVWVLAVFLR